MASKQHETANTQQERRSKVRSANHFGVEFDAAECTVVGVSRDASAQGILVNTFKKFSPGEDVVVTIYGGRTRLRVKACIVRVEPLASESRFPWRYATAAQFAEPVPELERLFARK